MTGEIRYSLLDGTRSFRHEGEGLHREGWEASGEVAGGWGGDQETRKLFTQIRRSTLQLLSDLQLMNRVIDELKRNRRWRGRVTDGCEFGSASRQAESVLSRMRRGGAT